MPTFPLLMFPQILIYIATDTFFDNSGFHFHKDLTSKQMTLMLHAMVCDFIVNNNYFKKF